MVLIGGIMYQIINVLFVLMSTGATPVANTNGTTAAMVDQARAHVASVRGK